MRSRVVGGPNVGAYISLGPRAVDVGFWGVAPGSETNGARVLDGRNERLFVASSAAPTSARQATGPASSSKWKLRGNQPMVASMACE